MKCTIGLKEYASSALTMAKIMLIQSNYGEYLLTHVKHPHLFSKGRYYVFPTETKTRNGY